VSEPPPPFREIPPPPPEPNGSGGGGVAIPASGEPMWGPGEALLGVLIAVAVAILGGIPVFLIAGDEGTDATLLSQLLLELAFLTGAFTFALRVAGNDWLAAARRLGLRRPQVAWIGLTLGGLGAYFATAILLSALGADAEQVDVTEELGFDASVLGAIAAGVLIVLVAPIVEEIFFRGFFFAGMRTKMRPELAMLISGLFFGAIHLTTGNLVVGLQLSVLGVILAYLYNRTGSLWSPIALHMVNNALAFGYLVSS
jgi:membrane protease YdiL (CAAX protease family)